MAAWRAARRCCCWIFLLWLGLVGARWDYCVLTLAGRRSCMACLFSWSPRLYIFLPTAWSWSSSGTGLPFHNAAFRGRAVLWVVVIVVPPHRSTRVAPGVKSGCRATAPVAGHGAVPGNRSGRPTIRRLQGKPPLEDSFLDQKSARQRVQRLPCFGGHRSGGGRNQPSRKDRIAAAASGAWNTEVPATITSAPWPRAIRAVSALIPPSTSMW
jgi:hypothetical protein